MRETVAFFKWPLAATVAGLVTATAYGGLSALSLVAVLIALEAALSFDNAVINAAVLRRLSEVWQRVFLTAGMVIAVFGMRVLFPIAIVSFTSGQSFTGIVHQALHNQEAYARNVEAAAPMIGAFGGIFLLLLALSFLFAPDRERRWIGPVERALGHVGRLPSAPTIVAGVTLIITSQVVATAHERQTLLAGLVGIVAFLTVRGFRDLLEQQMPGGATGLSGAAGLASFFYLEALDASFSLDGVLGAFAISSDIIIVAVGLGVGAIYVRSLTVYLVRHQTLRELPYLTHGAYWAIGALAVFLLVSIEMHPPEWLAGAVGLGFIAAAWVSSIGAHRQTLR